MSPKIYTQKFKETVVKFYERNHTIEETIQEFGISQTSLFDWRKLYSKEHDLIINGSSKYKNFRQSQAHLKKTEYMLEVVRKASCGVNAPIDEKMSAIKELEGQYSIHVLCEALNLPRGTYYNRKRREKMLTQHDKDDEFLKPIIKQVFFDSKKRFGRKPIQYKLKEMGYQVSEKRVCRLMQEMGLEVEKPKYMAEHKKPIPRYYFKHYLMREFEQSRPNQVWVSDITYVKVGNEYFYVCIILDLFSRIAISYGISDVMDTTLTMKTFGEAFKKRGKPKSLMFHSDQGVQYTSFAFRQYLKSKKVKQSFSTPGKPYDNSVCEAFFHSLKKEAIYHNLYSSPEELKLVMEEYLHFYNKERPHRKLNMKTPFQIETEFNKH